MVIVRGEKTFTLKGREKRERNPVDFRASLIRVEIRVAKLELHRDNQRLFRKTKRVELSFTDGSLHLYICTTYIISHTFLSLFQPKSVLDIIVEVTDELRVTRAKSYSNLQSR